MKVGGESQEWVNEKDEYNGCQTFKQNFDFTHKTSQIGNLEKQKIPVPYSRNQEIIMSGHDKKISFCKVDKSDQPHKSSIYKQSFECTHQSDMNKNKRKMQDSACFEDDQTQKI